MISFDRKDVILLWRDSRKDRATCRFCFFKNQYDYVEDVSGNCPIAYNCNNCIVDDEDNVNNCFSNLDCIVYATIYKCLIKETECFRDCSECAINNIIEETQINS